MSETCTAQQEEDEEKNEQELVKEEDMDEEEGFVGPKPKRLKATSRMVIIVPPTSMLWIAGPQHSANQP